VLVNFILYTISQQIGRIANTTIEDIPDVLTN